MDISVLQTSRKVYLQDVSEQWKELEGEDLEEDKHAFVTVRIAPEAVLKHVAEVTCVSEVKYALDSAGKPVSVSTISGANPFEIVARAVYGTVIDAGNITEGEYPVFRALPLNRMKFGAFYQLWSQQSPILCDAIFAAVTQMNPDLNLQ